MISLDKLDVFHGDELTVIIETPKGSQNKYTYEPRFGAFALDGVLPAGAVFPFDFGFVPSTIGDDRDPLDVLVLMDAATFTGCIVPSRLIGVIEAEQTENGKTMRNDRLIAVAAKSITHRSLREISDVSDDLVAKSSTSSSPTICQRPRRSSRRGAPDRSGRWRSEDGHRANW
jgi:inorganic pyrophosphatase